MAPKPGVFRGRPEDLPRQIAAAPQQGSTDSDAEKPTGLLGAHGGKLAAGAAAMLGLAIFYKWRENQLAKDDPEEYARLQRLKAVIAAGKATRKKKDQPPHADLK